MEFGLKACSSRPRPKPAELWPKPPPLSLGPCRSSSPAGTSPCHPFPISLSLQPGPTCQRYHLLPPVVADRDSPRGASDPDFSRISCSERTELPYKASRPPSASFFPSMRYFLPKISPLSCRLDLTARRRNCRRGSCHTRPLRQNQVEAELCDKVPNLPVLSISFLSLSVMLNCSPNFTEAPPSAVPRREPSTSLSRPPFRP